MDRFHRMLRDLREFCPTVVPVRVRRVPLDDCLGYAVARHTAEGHLSHFYVALDSQQSWDSMWQVLVHEWAHCLAWHEGHETVDDHGPEWGLAVARVYQDVVEV